MLTYANCLLDSPRDVAMLSHREAADPASGIFRVKSAGDPWERQAYAALRNEVFCREQGLFADDDRDAYDSLPGTISLVAVSYAAVMDDEVVGVRTYEASPGIWFGSRLAVARGWRGVPTLAASLIRAAVLAGRANGCEVFRATVQRQNVPLFRRLHWRSISNVEVCGLPHQLMEADLNHYSLPGAQRGRS